MYKLRFYDKWGNFSNEEFFDTVEELHERFHQVFQRELYSLNPTWWRWRDGHWRRLHEVYDREWEVGA